MQSVDTITALATGWGTGDRALIRLSGPQVPELLERCFNPGIPMPGAARATKAAFQLHASHSSPPRASVPSSLRAFLPLPTLLLIYPAPRSYTGEHSAELLLPGNPALIERVLAALLSHPGVREASPGEFSARAYLAGKMTLAQAEGVAATIAARNDDELAAARRVLDGSAGSLMRTWCDELATLLALVEAGIDFTDQEDVVPVAPTALVRHLSQLRESLMAYVGHVKGAESRSANPVVVLAGAPNAGKSTLFNALLGRHRAVVSRVAGTTRDVIVEDLDLSRDIPGGPVVKLTDLAGVDAALLRAAPHSTALHIDSEAQQRARQAIAEADVVVHCDPSGRFVDDLPQHGKAPVIRLQTKADLPHVHQAKSPAPWAVAPSLAVCALDGWNLGPLRRAIADSASQDRASGSLSVLPRHQRSLTHAVASISEAIARLKAPVQSSSPGGPDHQAIMAPELIAGSLREALDELGSLVGRISPDDVIGRIFATFCIGK
ncbi:MAG: 50S ribosome-binding GTPase [Pyrinomonadaceae bacterium]|nr:50S ribosome-binding GTPase [Phycisphaerales bacterium]